MSRVTTPEDVILIYGGYGLGKSTLAAEAAAYIWKKHGLKTRVINADGGGTSIPFSPLVEAGIASIWNIDTWAASSIFLNLNLATKGWWPEDVNTPNSRLLEPVREWRACPECKGDSGAKGLVMVAKCASCGVSYGAGKLLPVAREPINGLEEVGLIVFEGFAGFGDLLMQRLRDINSASSKEEGAVKDGDYEIKKNSKYHYGDAQKEVGQWMTNVRQIPVQTVLWTTLELRADDDGKPIYGPAFPGKALTAIAGRWFTAVLHLDAIPKKVNGIVVKDAQGFEQLERLLYLAPHYPSDNPTMKFAAKVSSPMPGAIPPVIQPSMKLFFELKESAKLKAKEALLGPLDSSEKKL